MRFVLSLSTALLLCLPLFAAAAEIRVGIYNNSPLNFVDDRGNPSGLFPELLDQIAKEKGWKLSYRHGTWDECLARLESGEIDLLPAIAYTEPRSQKFRFVRETVVTNWGQVFQRPGEKLDSILKLDDKRLAVLKEDVHYLGPHGIAQVAKNFDINIRFHEVSSYLEAFTLLANEEVDAALVNRLFGLKQQQRFDLAPTTILLNPVQLRPAFSQASAAALPAQFDEVLARWKQDANSTYFQLLNRWLGDNQRTPLPRWVENLLLVLALLLCLVFFAALWCRRQVKRQTRQLSEKNRELEDELQERQQIERALRERQQQYQVLFEDSHTAILLVDPVSASIVDVNPAASRFYQYPREQMQGMKLTRLNPLSEGELRKRISMVQQQSQQQFQFQHRLADGQLRDVEVHSSPIVVEGRSLLCSIVHDISARKQSDRELEQRNQFLQTIIDGVSDPLMVISPDYKVLQMNQAARDQLPNDLQGIEDLPCHLVSHASQLPCSGDDHPCPLREVAATGEPVTLIHQHVTNKGRRIVELKGSPLFNPDGSLMAVIEVARDITERLKVEELLNENERRLHHLAHHDPLTDLPNRLLFEDRIKQALSKARRSEKQLALFFLDLDHFKDVNDNLGHDFGDLLLIDIASRLRSCVRESDTVARMGGDEFLVLLDEVDSLEMVEAMAERISHSLVHELARGHYYQRVSASIGISLYPQDGISSQELLKNADIAMYRAKNLGKNTYQFYSQHQIGRLFE